MGITIVQKSDLQKPKRNPKIALVLSGGAVSGGAFKLGGLRAFNSFMVNRSVKDFDMFVGISAGSVIASYLANDVSVDDIYMSMIDRRGPLSAVKPFEFYSLNKGDILKTPLHVMGDLVSITSRKMVGFLACNNIFRKQFREQLYAFATNPSTAGLERFTSYCFERKELAVNHPSLPWHYLPNGIFKTDKIEQATRKNFKKNDLCNDFNELYRRTGKELYIVAMQLDTARRTIFGHDQVNTIPVSKAMQASIAFPLFFKPVTIDGADYIDGAVIKTTSMDFAIEKGADLVICYNPFRPFNHESFDEHNPEGRKRISIARDGIAAVINQVMRTLLHTRLMHGIKLYRENPDFKGDIILIEPTEHDDRFFDMNPFSLNGRRKAASRGFESVSNSLKRNYPAIKALLEAYGIEANTEFA
jgi:predicted acylesterase/phospholipase RssA